MKLQYLPIQQTQENDVVQAVRDSNGFTTNKLYITSAPYNFSGGYRSADVGPGTINVVQDDNNTGNGWGEQCFKLVKTKPGSEAKVGDICIMIHNHPNQEGPKINTTFKVIEIKASDLVMTDIDAPIGYPTWVMPTYLFKVLYSSPTRITRTKPLEN